MTDLVAQNVLDAMEGLAYTVGLDGRMVAVGQRNWDAALPPRSEHLQASRIIGRNLFDFVAGDDVAARYRSWMNTLTADAAALVTFAFRCAAPDEERSLRMSITRIDQEGEPIGFLFQSTLLSVERRPPIDLFDVEARLRQAEQQMSLPATTLCSFCERLRPEGGGDGPWLEAEQYYRAGGSSRVRLSHGICPDCADKLP